ncbi:MAG TPA: AarF/UbiB family protein, partial [Thermoanaerobaculia bacterium]|nr:AarF/UbiB family protein [Thermoanaerobaculia bacterium]
RLVREDTAEAVEADLELLPLAGEALVAQGWTAPAVQDALDGFRQHLREQADLRSAIQDLDLLAGDAAVFSRLAVPAVFRDLTTARLLTVADLGGVSLGQVAPAGSRELARSFCALWWRQVLAGRLFPLDLGAEDVRVLPDGRIAFQGAAFARSTTALQADLREGLVAVVYRDPDAACTALLREMVREDGARSEEELRLRLRQIVPFRDGSWSPSGESLAEHLFLYARTARECGYRPRRPLLELYRGLFAVALLSRRLAPGCDPLSEGLQEFRLLAGFSQVREAMSFDSWSGQLDRYALLMVSLPQRLDELLTRASEEDARPVSPREGRAPRRAESSHLVLAAALMVMAALALLLHHFVQAGALAGQGEKVSATLFLVVGGLLLWALGRAR